MKHSERGSAILMLFVLVALFGILSFVFLKSSDSNVGWLTKEQDKATATGSQDCVNVTNMAVKRLTLRGCGSKISYDPSGSNTNPGAPADGSCSVFHTNGGGAKPCGNLGQCSASELLALSVGQTCGNAIYAGTSGGHRIYAAKADQGNMTWASPAYYCVTGATSQSDGLTNTNLLLSLSIGCEPYLAAASCRSLGSKWYLPAVDEMALLRTNRNVGDLAGTLNASNYWTSVEFISGNAFYVRMSDGAAPTDATSFSATVRCVRRD